jgi:hypothetical protein
MERKTLYYSEPTREYQRTCMFFKQRENMRIEKLFIQTNLILRKSFMVFVYQTTVLTMI